MTLAMIGLAGANVNAHAFERVDHAQRVGAMFHVHARAGTGDVGDVRREFDDHRLVGHRAQPVHKIGEGHRVGAHASMPPAETFGQLTLISSMSASESASFSIDRRVIVIAMSGDIEMTNAPAALSLGRSSAK